MKWQKNHFFSGTAKSLWRQNRNAKRES